MLEENLSEKFSKNGMFTYNYYKKIVFVIVLACVIFLCIAFGLYYFFYLKNADNFLVRTINLLVLHVTSNMGETTLLGSFYASLFGGLFFIPIPIELAYIAFLRAGHSVIVLTLVYMLGIFLSYEINYQIGFRLSGISKKIIGAKSFYKTKLSFNKYGPFGIFLFNVTPLPSQALCTVLGVFNYNKKKFWFYTMLGEVIKFIVIAIGYFYIT